MVPELLFRLLDGVDRGLQPGERLVRPSGAHDFARVGRVNLRDRPVGPLEPFAEFPVAQFIERLRVVSM
jgi:hypothetical protein